MFHDLLDLPGLMSHALAEGAYFDAEICKSTNWHSKEANLLFDIASNEVLSR